MNRALTVLILIGLIGMLVGCATVPQTRPYDPNDAAYKFIPAAPADWIEMFGDNERTRLLHSISELRVVVNRQGETIDALVDAGAGPGHMDAPPIEVDE